MNSLSSNPGLAFRCAWFLACFGWLLFTPRAETQEATEAVLPPGVRAVWDPALAHRETTPTRERICLNGLWRWQPASTAAPTNVPGDAWGFFKVPGCWPGITDYMQKDCQTVFSHPSWASHSLALVSAAWYQRSFSVPKAWHGRRIALSIEWLNSFAVVFVDGQPQGELRFPGGELDLTASCQPGRTHTLTLWVAAWPLQGVLLSFSDTAAAREVKGSVPRRGLCGDVFLSSAPEGPRIGDVRVNTSVRRRELSLSAELSALATNDRYRLRARVSGGPSEPVQEFFSQPFGASDLAEGRFDFAESWMPDMLWDTHTPQHQLQLSLALLNATDSVVDAHWPIRFGFREFWIEGRDFILNGSRIALSAVPLDNAQVGAAHASYVGARESLERLRGFGINFVYTHNYDGLPGSHLSFAEILRAADDVGMLIGFSQPHFSHYDWKAPDAMASNGYAQHAAFYVRAAHDHPSVVMYAMSHNATGYDEDMNPDKIDGAQDARDAWASRNAVSAQKAEAIVRRLDPSRIVYHHASGNLGSMHSVNFYPNFAPMQELSDWFEHWATVGQKPLFLCEYGAPFTWDWTMYRGWFKGEREFGSARVPWEFCVAEWNAQFLGDHAYRLSEPERANLRWEAQQFRDGKRWHRWDYPHTVSSTQFHDRYAVFAAYLNDNWRAFRTWNVSAISPWEHEHFWRLRDGFERQRHKLPVEWERLQQPGFSPDYRDAQYERMDLAFARSDWVPTPAAESLIRNNRPLLAYLAGTPARFTSKDHIFLPGETFEKQLIVINNSRETVDGDARWSLGPGPVAHGQLRFQVRVGDQSRLPIRIVLPNSIAPGRYALKATVRFNTNETQEDSFIIDVLEPAAPRPAQARIGLFDPRGESSAMLKRLGIALDVVEANDDLSNLDLLIVGRRALDMTTPAPDLRRVRQGLKVIVFEQTADVLEQRLGFRAQTYGLRQVFPRVPDHPAIEGLAREHWRDWRGEATLVATRLNYTPRPQHGPTIQWCGLPVSRVWRCGNQGNVASVLIEKPARGDFLPILDGGFSLQYSPLLEFREGQGMILFCQLDVTGRTEAEPVSERLVRNLIAYAKTWKPSPTRDVVYAGEPAGQQHLASLGLEARTLASASLGSNDVLVLGPGFARDTDPAHLNSIRDWLRAGGRFVSIGLDQVDADALGPFGFRVRAQEHIGTFFESFPLTSPFRGVAPADVHNRDPRTLPLITGGAEVIGNGVLGHFTTTAAVMCQLVPWTFQNTNQMNLKRTHRRVSYLVTRLLANQGARGQVPLLQRFASPLDSAAPEQRWLEGLYLDRPEEWDDPYRFFRW